MAITLFSCKEDDEIEPDDEEEVIVSPNIAINNWIQAVMEYFYYWNENMGTPIANTADPEQYFDALVFEQEDRFSEIYPNYQELVGNLSGVSTEAGYEFSLLRESETNQNVLALVSYTKKNSPAATAGLKRGDLITQINGTTMNLDNYQSLLRNISANHNITYRRYDFETGFYGQGQSLSLNAINLEENPNFLDTVYTIENKKIGYLVYHFFAPGIRITENELDSRYDQQMDAAFAKFKAENVSQLILDFRYNGGGYVSSAANLASLIAPGITSTDIFSDTKYNSTLAALPQLQNSKTPFKIKNENIGNNLTDSKIYIITSSRTASASELIINALRPYMQVEILGDTTVGKNVGSIAIEDEGNNENLYGLLPIISRSYNSLGQSEYTDGFFPDFYIREIDNLPYLEFGDINEPLLRATLDRILSRPPSDRRTIKERQFIGSSLDRKIRQGLLLEDSKSVKEAFGKIK